MRPDYTEEERRQAFCDRFAQIRAAHVDSRGEWNKSRFVRETGIDKRTLVRMFNGSPPVGKPDDIFIVCMAMDCTSEEIRDLLTLAGHVSPDDIREVIKKTTEHEIPNVKKPEERPAQREDDPERETGKLAPLPRRLIRQLEECC